MIHPRWFGDSYQRVYRYFDYTIISNLYIKQPIEVLARPIELEPQAQAT